MEYCLETEGLSKSYRHFKALGGLNMHVPKGSIYGFVGRNGAGKTTLIRIIAGLQEPTSGSYTLYGCRNDAGDIRNARKRMGAVVETPSIYLDMTARENLMQQYRILGMPSSDGIDELLELVDLKDKENVYPSQLSGGQKQRVAIARALANNPGVLLSDEATSALDPEATESILNLLKKLNKQLGLTIVLITHEMTVIKTICSKVAVMENGAVVEQGDVYDIFAHPKQPVTKKFINTVSNLSKINRLSLIHI